MSELSGAKTGSDCDPQVTYYVMVLEVQLLRQGSTAQRMACGSDNYPEPTQDCNIWKPKRTAVVLTKDVNLGCASGVRGLV